MHGWKRRFADALLMGGAYGAVSYAIMQAAAFGHPTGSVFWPGAGLTLGVLVRTSRDRWPALLVGVAVAEVVVDLSLPVGAGTALAWALANTAEPLVGALLLTRAGRIEGLSSVSLVLRFVVGAVVAAPLVAATIGSVAAAATGVGAFWPTWPRWWIGDAIGVLVVAPALFTLGRTDLSPAGRLERWLVLAAVGVVTSAAVLPWQEEGWAHGLPFLLAPALALAAMRLGPRTAAITLALSATTVNAVTAMGLGPFVATSADAGVVVAQVCLAGAAFALHTVSALNHGLVSVRQMEQLLRHQAMHDGLTGLANRRMLDDQLAAELAGLARSRTRLAVLMVDLDGFKQLNDAHGHLAGDAALVEVADRLRACVRPTDTVARTGGDEFVVLLPGLSGIDEAEQCRDRVHAALNRSMAWHGAQLALGASVGLSSTTDPATSVDELLSSADREMYAVKARSGGRAGD